MRAPVLLLNWQMIAQRRAWRVGVLLVALSCCCAPLGFPVVEAPPWTPMAFGTGNADLVGVIDLAALRADRLFGPVLTRLARRDGLQVLLRASQIDAVGSGTGGKLGTWVAVVHGVEGPPRERDVGSGMVADIMTVPGAWLLGAGPAFRRVRASPPRILSRISMPDRALVVSTVQGDALSRPEWRGLTDATEGLTQATVAVLGGNHLEFVLQCRYVDHPAAQRAATVTRLVLLAVAARDDAWSLLARALLKVDFDVSGDVVFLRITISDDVRDLLESYAVHATD
jgi:hypothetical protein